MEYRHFFFNVTVTENKCVAVWYIWKYDPEKVNEAVSLESYEKPMMFSWLYHECPVKLGFICEKRSA